jgi:hypothetical protein
MQINRRFRLGSLALLCGLLGSPAWAQDHTGMISGTVVDDQGNVVPGVSVSFISEATGYTRTLSTDGHGEFRFLGVQPGTYTVRVELTGFSIVERRSQVLPTSSSLNLGKIKLALGTLQDTITVVAEGTVVEAQNTDHSGLLTAKQIEQIGTIGRDVASLLRLLPGVSYQGDADSLGGGLPTISGTRRDFNHVTIDGVFANNIGGPSSFGDSPINLDAVAEVKVTTSTYKAELGRGAAQIQITGKTGGSDFKGHVGYFKRHDSLNANDFFRNLQGDPRGRYRFDTVAASLGGPVAIPGLMDAKKQKKLFFFYSGQREGTQTPRPFQEWRVPTMLERQGDFSQSFRRTTRNSAGQLVPGTLIVVIDPRTGQPFPGNVVPADRITPSGRALLNLFPEPNFNSSDPTNPHNYRFEPNSETPKQNHSLRFDYRPSPENNFYMNLRLNDEEQQGFQNTLSPGERGRWGFYNNHYEKASRVVTLGHTHIFNSRVVNEFLVSYRRDTEKTFVATDAELQRMQRAGTGFAIPNINPSANRFDLLPNATFQGANIPSLGGDNIAQIEINNRFPLAGRNWAVNVRDNFTWATNAHLFKGGLYFELIYDLEGRGGGNNGTFDFRHDSNNPFSTGYGYANALVGSFHSYTEASRLRNNDGRGALLEWYGQDTWRATSRLTFDLGTRFQWVVKPWTKADKNYTVFVPDRWDPAKAPLLYVPYYVGTQLRAMDPRVGPSRLLGSRFVGTYIPGTGDPNNGIVFRDDPNYPSGFRSQLYPLVEPRLGFVYDVRGDGKTAVRGGAGLYHQPHLGVGIVTDLGGNPPFGRNFVTDFGTFDTLTGLETVLSVTDARGFDPDMKGPSNFGFSLGFEQAVGFGTVVGVTYVGNLGRHLNQNTNLNTIPDGTRFKPENRDNRTPSGAYPDNLLRPYRGYGALNYRSNFGTSSYNGLQTSIIRRYAKGLQFSVAYTWARALGIGDEDNSLIVPYRPANIWNYAPNERSQTHNLQISYTLDLPKGAKWNNRLLRGVLGDWQLSGEYSLVSGNWGSVDFDRDDIDYTGGQLGTPDNVRTIVTGDPNNADHGGHDKPWFDTSVFKPPVPAQLGQAVGPQNYGNTPRRLIRRPGVNNLNLHLFKNFRLGGHRTLQLRWETYNVLNHTQFDGLSLEASFDALGNIDNQDLVAKTGFGFPNSARPPRRMQGAVRFWF